MAKNCDHEIVRAIETHPKACSMKNQNLILVWSQASNLV